MAQIVRGERTKLAKALARGLSDDWYIEGQGAGQAQVYNHNIFGSYDKPPSSAKDLVTIEVIKRGDSWDVSSSAYNERRGMGDLVSHRSARSIPQAVDEARALASELRERAQSSQFGLSGELDFGF